MTGRVSPRGERRGSLWRSRPFRLFWTGETTSELGSAVTTVALPLVAVVSLHASTFVVTVLSAAIWLPWLLIGIPAGAWVDRLSPRPIMLACDALSLLAFASVPVAAWTGVLGVPQLVVVALVAGAASVLFNTAYQALLPRIVSEGDLTEANAKLGGSRSAAQIGGPGLGGVIAQVAGPAGGLLADAVSFAVSFVCLSALRTPPRDRSAERAGPSSITGESLQGLSLVWHDPYLRAQAIFGAAANLTLTGMTSLIVVFLVRTVGLRAGAVGALLATFGIGGVLGALAARPLAQRFGSSRAVLLCTIGCLPFALLLPLTHEGVGLTFAVVANLLTSAGVVASNIIGGSFRQVYVPESMIGRVSSTVMTASFATMPAGALLAGLLATSLGIRPTLWILAAGIGASGLVFLATPMRRLRDLPMKAPSDASLPCSQHGPPARTLPPRVPVLHLPHMETVGVRELQQHASAALRRVERGEQLGVTDRGRLVAVLVPPSAAVGAGALVAAGRVQPARAQTSPLPDPVRSHLSIEDALGELRGER